MAISNTRTRNEYTLDSLTTQFDITFDCVLDDNGNATQLAVWLIENGTYTELDNPDDYTVSALKVVYSDAPNHAGAKLLVTRETPLTQLMDFVNNGSYNLQQIEEMSDKLTRIVQEQSTKLDDNSTASKSASDAEDWAVGTRSDGLAPQHTADCSKAWADYVASTVGAHSTSLDYLDNYSANVDTVAANASDINTVAGDIANVNSVAGDLTNIDAVAANETDIDTVAADISDVSTVAADISNVNAVAGDLTNVDAVVSNATNINTVAGDKTNIDAVAGNKTNIDAVAGNSTNINTVAGISSDVTTVASNVSDINTVVSNLSGILASDDYASLARQYSEGKKLDGTDVVSGEAGYHDNSKYYLDIVKQTISGALRYQGVWTTTGATDYSGISLPRLKGDMFYCQGSACTIDGVTYSQGDYIIFNQDVSSGTITTSMIDKVDNTETVTPDNLVTLTNKTIDAKDNTILNTPTTVVSSTTPVDLTTGKTNFYINTSNGYMALPDNAPHKNYKVTVTCNGAGYVRFRCIGDNYRVVYMQANQTITFIYSYSYWMVQGGTTLFTTDGTISGEAGSTWTEKPNDWKQCYGLATYHFINEGATVADYDFPIKECSITVTWKWYTNASAIAQQWLGVSTPSPIWTRKMGSTWATFWTRFDGTAGGSNTEHTVTTFGSSVASGNIYYIIRNGVCFVDVKALQMTATGNSQGVCTLPKPKFSTNVSGIVANSEADTTINGSFYVPTNGALNFNCKNTAKTYAFFSYPVADDYVES